MANQNFVVHNGLTVGPLTIDAATGSITTTGSINTSGLAVEQLASGGSNITVTNSYVNVAVNGGNIAAFGAAGLNLTGNLSAAYVIGNGSQLTGLPAGYTNVQVATYFASGTAASLINTSGNVLGSAATFSTGLFNSSTNTTGAGSGAVQVSGGAYIAQDLWVAGNIYTGNLIGVTSNIITIQDSLIYLNRANTYPYGYSIGLYSHYIGGPANAYVHTGITRQPNDGTWWFLSNIGEPNPLSGNINVYDSNRILDSIQAGAINLTGNVVASAGIVNTLTVNGTATATSGVTVPSITKSGTNGVGDIGQTGNRFATIYGLATSAQYADLAEKYLADAEYAPGTVLHFGGEQEVSQCDADMCTRVAGVVSTNPAHVMNDALEGEYVATVALTGRVPCKVQGAIRKGDMMVSAGNGYARAEADPRVGSVIGKALENFDGLEGVIEVVVGRL